MIEKVTAKVDSQPAKVVENPDYEDYKKKEAEKVKQQEIERKEAERKFKELINKPQKFNVDNSKEPKKLDVKA